MGNAMKGWVYVITNPSMPGICKVGTTDKDPEERALELNHTGTPRPYVVEYEVLVENAREYEQAAHRLLEKEGKHDAKEWFKCSPEEAVIAVKTVVGDKVILETYKRVEKAKAEELRREREREEAEAKRRKEQAETEKRRREEDLRLQQEREEQIRQQEKKRKDAIECLEKGRNAPFFESSEDVLVWLGLALFDAFMIYALFTDYQNHDTASNVGLVIILIFLTLLVFSPLLLRIYISKRGKR